MLPRSSRPSLTVSSSLRQSTTVGDNILDAVAVVAGRKTGDPVVQASVGHHVLWVPSHRVAFVFPQTPGWLKQGWVLCYRPHRHCPFACLLGDVHAGLTEVGLGQLGHHRREV